MHDRTAACLWRVALRDGTIEPYLGPGRLRRIAWPCSSYHHGFGIAADAAGRLYLPAFAACRIWQVDPRTRRPRVLTGHGLKGVRLWKEDVFWCSAWDEAREATASGR